MHQNLGRVGLCNSTASRQEIREGKVEKEREGRKERNGETPMVSFYRRIFSLSVRSAKFTVFYSSASV